MADSIKPIGHLDNGLTPVFLFDEPHQVKVEEFIARVHEETQETQFYLLGHETIQIKENNVTTSKFQPRFFLVNYSTIGYTCDAVEMSSFNDRKKAFGRTIKESASFSLPKIPHHLIAEIDGFFRYVYDKNKTEGVVILTYDPTLVVEGAEEGVGWGYQIPNQENTAGRCDYEADSVIEHMEETAFVVGSAHSHPMMSAFCSHVDKSDQANFPGVHITFGWGENGADPSVTHHHCEFQLGDQAWTLKPQQLFGPAPATSPGEELKKLVDERVKKPDPGFGKSKTAPKSFTSKSTPTSSGSTNRKKSEKKNNTSYYEPRSPKSTVKRVNLPEEIADIDFNSLNNILVWSPLLKKIDLKECPCCESKLDKNQVNAFRCRECHTYIHGVDYNFSDIADHRKQQKTLPFAGLGLKVDQPQSVWYVIEQYVDEDGDGDETVLEVELLHEGTLAQKAKA